MTKSFDGEEARKAQAKYCEDNDLPLFAPWNGMCYRCLRNIYAGEYGITLEGAANGLITCCPYCHYSFCD